MNINWNSLLIKVAPFLFSQAKRIIYNELNTDQLTGLKKGLDTTEALKQMVIGEITSRSDEEINAALQSAFSPDKNYNFYIRVARFIVSGHYEGDDAGYNRAWRNLLEDITAEYVQIHWLKWALGLAQIAFELFVAGKK